MINIGTLSAPWIESMLIAGRAASERGVPVVLDPVGAGATRLRTETAIRILNEVRPKVVRGNASEILACARQVGETKGVESTRGVAETHQVAADLAAEWKAVVAVTGPEDFVTDGKRHRTIGNGHPLMSRVTGVGCASTAIVGAFCAVEEDALSAAVSGLAVFEIAAELGARTDPRPGSFRSLLLDGLDEVDGEVIRERIRVSEVDVPK